MEELINMLNLFKAGKITQYAVEKELSKFMGMSSSCQFANDSKNTHQTSYFIMPLVEKRVEGLHVIFLIDADAVLRVYTANEIMIALNNLLVKKQEILKRYNAFYRISSGNEVSRNAAIGFILSVYQSVKECLNVNPDLKHLPNDAELAEAITKLREETATKSDIESYLIKELFAPEVMKFAEEKISHSIPGPKIIVSDEEKPTFNLGQQEILKHCTSTFGVRDHKEIQYNYKPSTNQ